MELQKKFDKGAESHTYQRIDADYRTNIFLGYNDDGQMSMVITESGKDVAVKSSQIINVQLKKREDNKLALSFDLIDISYKSLFLVFCKDIIITSEKAGNEMAISNALIRWKYWKEMFGKRRQNILDKMEIKGLIGELIELKEYFMERWDETTAITSWMGPLLGHKDFEIEETWYEIKSVNENAVQVTISSLEQLESDAEGHLVIIRLEDTNTSNNQSINLNQMVADISNKIIDPENMGLFLTKLDNVGYEYNTEYDNYNFTYKGTQRYSVGNDFPRIRRSEINPSIGNVKYTILLDGISEFREV